MTTIPTKEAMGNPAVGAAEASKLRMFRNVAAEVRAALATQDDEGAYRMIRGYVESDEGLTRIRAVSVPLRRTYLRGDPVNFGKMAAILENADSESVRERLGRVMVNQNEIEAELDSASILDETRVLHREMLEAWLDAAVYQDFGDKGNRFREMVDRFGKTVEGIAWHLTERLAHRVLELDEVIALALDEPVMPEASDEGD